MSTRANRRHSKTFWFGAWILFAFSFFPGLLLAQEPQTPPPPSLPAPLARTAEKLAIRAGRLFDGKSDDLKKQQVILVEGTRIVQVGSANDVHIPPDTEVLDFINATVLPGLIDGHTHVFTSGPAWYRARACRYRGVASKPREAFAPKATRETFRCRQCWRRSIRRGKHERRSASS